MYIVCKAKKKQLVFISVRLLQNLTGLKPIEVLSVKNLVTALKEKVEIPSSCSFASKWCTSPPINHRVEQTDSGAT